MSPKRSVRLTSEMARRCELTVGRPRVLLTSGARDRIGLRCEKGENDLEDIRTSSDVGALERSIHDGEARRVDHEGRIALEEVA